MTETKYRTKQFALQIMKLVDELPKTTVGRAIDGQLVRSGTSVGANYRAACRARSKAEFISKLGIVLEEADESGFWLELNYSGCLGCRLKSVSKNTVARSRIPNVPTYSLNSFSQST